MCDDVVAYQSDFLNDGDDGWIFVGSDGGTTTCDDDTFLGGYNVLANYDMAQKLVELPPHTSLQIDFTFVKIDSWDSEYAVRFAIFCLGLAVSDTVLSAYDSSFLLNLCRFWFASVLVHVLGSRGALGAAAQWVQRWLATVRSHQLRVD